MASDALALQFLLSPGSSVILFDGYHTLFFDFDSCLRMRIAKAFCSEAEQERDDQETDYSFLLGGEDEQVS